jgi:GNAT superfamily N-acetyltransferase
MLAAMDLDLRATADLSAEDIAELRALHVRVHGPPDVERLTPGGQLRWAGLKDMLCVVRVRDAAVLVSCAFVTAREILVNGNPVRAGGLCDVQTDPDYRLRGFARAAVQAATNCMSEQPAVELGLLFSSEMAVPLYESLGWRVFDGPVYCEQQVGIINYTELMPAAPPMVLVPGSGSLSGSIDLCGLPW